MSQWTVSRRMAIGFTTVLAITAIVNSYLYVRATEIVEATTVLADDALPGIYLTGEIMAATREGMNLVSRHIAAGDDAGKQATDQEIRDSVAKLDGIYKEFERTVSEPREKELLAAVAGPRAEFRQIRDTEILVLSRAHKTEEALARTRDRLIPAFTRYAAAVQALMDQNKATGDEHAKEIKAAASSTEFGLVAGSLLAIGAGIAIALLIVRTTNKVLSTSIHELRSGSEQIVAAAGQVATSAQSLSQGATEQAASLEETSASMEEMASMTRKNADNSHEASSLMSEVDGRVSDSNASLKAMVGAMDGIKDSSTKVARIIKTIDEIAFQTNILALNAAVEAARAGDAGMGFAVVADEVRNLAQRSAQAAKDTAALIEQSITSAQEGGVKVEQVAAAIAGITDSVGRVKGLVDEVSVASRQQAQGIDQVSQAVAQMEKVTQSTAATAEESAAASEELNAQAETAMQIVAKLSALVGGQTAGAPAAPKGTRRTPAPREAKVVTMAPRPGVRSAEEQIPLGDGTYGRF